MYTIDKLFSSLGNAGLEKLKFFEQIQSDKKISKQGINLIYLADATVIKLPSKLNKLDLEIKIGPAFLASFNKLHVFGAGVIPPNMAFRSQRVQFNTYYNWVRQVDPTKLKLSRKIPNDKGLPPEKSIFYDITPVYPAFFNLWNSSEVTATKELFKLIEMIAQDFASNKTSFYKRNSYLMLDLQDYGNRDLIEAIFNYYRLNKKLINGIEGIIVRIDDKFWPLTEVKENGLAINMIVYNKIKKIKAKLKDEDGKAKHLEHLNPVEKDPESTEDSNEANDHLEVSLKKLKHFYDNKTVNVYTPQERKELDQHLDKIHNIISGASDDNSTLKKLAKDIPEFKDPKKLESLTTQDKIKILKKHPKFSKYAKYLEEIRNVNLKYNGAITIDEELVKQTSDTYFNPLDVVKIKDFHSFNRQSSEFNEVLDEAMYDLFKGIEQDPNAGIKVLDIKIRYDDNFKSRYKIYKVKIKNTKFGYSKPYDIELRVPYPVNGKYLKLDGVNYIMGNQFFPQPIVKTQADAVKIFTHFSTAAVELKGTTLNKTSDFFRLKDEFLKILTEVKALKSSSDISSEEIEVLKDEFKLSGNLNPALIFNLETR